MSKGTSNQTPDKSNLRGKGTPPISRQKAYSKAASHFHEALQTAVDVMRTSNNDSNRISAAKMIINKVLPDLKASDITTDGESLRKIIFNVDLGD